MVLMLSGKPVLQVLFQFDKGISHVLNEERTVFELGPQSIYVVIGWTETIQSIHRCFAVPTRIQFSPRLEHGKSDATFIAILLESFTYLPVVDSN